MVLRKKYMVGLRELVSVKLTVLIGTMVAMGWFIPGWSQENELSYDWFPSNTGGGGYITGIVQDKNNPDVLYARCDVGGVFKTIDKGRRWFPRNGGMTKWYHHSVQSIAVDPENSNVVFRCSGDKRNNVIHGSIHKSVDGGETWYEVLDRVGFYGNGETRMYGELIAVDPHDFRHVIAAGFTNGIWTSSDAGESWTYRAGKDENFTTVAVHPYRRNEYLAATLTGKLYRSQDQGATWKVVFESKDDRFWFTEFAFDSASPQVIYGAASNGMYKSNDGGKTFDPIMNGLPSGFQFNTVVSNPGDTKILYTAPDARPGHRLAPVPVYVSRDGGGHWSLISNHQWKNLVNYPGYMKHEVFVGWAIAKIRVDTGSENGLIFSNWYGVSFSLNGGADFAGNYFAGLETNCLENIQLSPTNEEVSFYTVADHMPMKSTDSGRNYASLPPNSYTSSTALVQSVADPSLLLFGARIRSKGSGAIVHFKDDIARTVFGFDSGYVQTIREDPFAKGTFYCSIDGRLKGVGGIYKSSDWGINWKKLPFTYHPYMINVPHEKEFIENELLNIVIGQKKNVCGSNQLMSLDPHQPNTIVVGEWTEGIFKSVDGGITWRSIASGLPFHKDTASVLTVVAHDPVRANRIYAGFIREGLWKSDDGGETWRKVFPTDGSGFNVSTLHVGGTTSRELYIGGENLFWANYPSTILYSADEGVHWKSIYDPALGALRIKSLDVDTQTGRILLATSGNGAFYAIRRK